MSLDGDMHCTGQRWCDSVYVTQLSTDAMGVAPYGLMIHNLLQITGESVSTLLRGSPPG